MLFNKLVLAVLMQVVSEVQVTASRHVDYTGLPGVADDHTK